MFIGIGIGIPFSRVLGGIVSPIVNAFKTRVLADSGTFEAESCLNTTVKNLTDLNLYDSASLIVTPNAYKASKIYSLKPTSGAGDLAFSRAGVKRVRNAAGNSVQIGANVPPLNYPVGGDCPSWLIEPQATNTILQSTNFIVSPWTVSSATIANTSLPSPIDGINWTRFTINNPTGQDRVIQSQTVAAGQVRTISVFIKADTFSGTVILRGDASGNTANANLNLATGVITNAGANLISSRLVNQGNGSRLELTFTTVLNPTTDITTFNTGVSGVSFLFTQIQLETGSVATSPIITAGSALTRLADVASLTGASALIGQTEGTILFELMNNNTSNNRILLRLNNSLGNVEFDLAFNSLNQLRLDLYNNGAFNANILQTSALPLGRNKFAVRYQSGNYALSLNGAVPITNNNTSKLYNWIISDLTLGFVGAQQISVLGIIPTALTNAEMQAYSTL